MKGVEDSKVCSCSGNENDVEKGIYNDDDTFLYATKTVIINEDITDELSIRLTKELLRLDSQLKHNKSDINIILTSYGGSCNSAFLLFDLISGLKTPVNIRATGHLMSAGTIVMLAVPKERRSASILTLFMIHELSSSISGSYSEMDSTLKVSKIIQETINRLYLENTNITKQKLNRLLSKDSYFDAKKALEYGFISKIV